MRLPALVYCLTVFIPTLIASGCAGPSASISTTLPYSSIPSHWELRDTPFFPQEEYQCGPAALSTILSASGIQLSPSDVSGKVYLPERRGSLQLELIAASRRYGRLPYLLDPTFSALLEELLQGRPVMVLQNLGLPAYPIWHYAVVIGYDRDKEQLVLRSGDQERHFINTRNFLRSWELSDYWALVVLRPDELPASPNEDRYVKGIIALESVASPSISAEFYHTAISQWPENSLARFGLGNMQYAQGNNDKAKAAFEGLLSIQPGHIAARHNLAYLLAEEGCYEAAITELDKGLASAEKGTPIHKQLLETRHQIRDRMQSDKSGTNACLHTPQH